MTFPIFVTLGPVRVSAHFIFESLAYAVGMVWYRRARKRSGDFLGSDQRWSIVAAAIVGAAFGSRVLNWFEDPGGLLSHVTDPAWLMSGKTVVGGLIGGTLAVEWIKRRLGITRRTGDLFAVPLAIGMAVGRMGCFCGGLPDNTYGVATVLPWGVDFGDGIRRHPTQIYEMLFLFAMAWGLARVAARPHREGDVYRIFLVSYLAFRLAIDALKPGVRMSGLTMIQWACLAAILAYWRDWPLLLAPWRNREWASVYGHISSTTQPSPSVPNAIGDVTPR